jgi:hypothetical protein
MVTVVVTGISTGVWAWVRPSVTSVFASMLALAVGVSMLAACSATAPRADQRAVAYRTADVDGLSISYREAGPSDGPVLLLLHGFPSSSRMFDPLFARLSDRFHLIAPDFPGFGHSDWPDPAAFDYTFDHIATVIGHSPRSSACRSITCTSRITAPT